VLNQSSADNAFFPCKIGGYGKRILAVEVLHTFSSLHEPTIKIASRGVDAGEDADKILAASIPNAFTTDTGNLATFGRNLPASAFQTVLTRLGGTLGTTWAPSSGIAFTENSLKQGGAMWTTGLCGPVPTYSLIHAWMWMDNIGGSVENLLIYEKKFGSAGGNTTLSFVGDGSGTGTLNESAYPAIVFHFAPGTTTPANFVTAVGASTHLAVIQAGSTSGTFGSGAAFGATNLIAIPNSYILANQYEFGVLITTTGSGAFYAIKHVRFWTAG
jgi:hypothetical protein